MFYRTDLYVHTKRVAALLEILLPLLSRLYPEFDKNKARLIAKHHDDYELQPIGDIPLQLKLCMGADELFALKKREILAAEAMADIYPKKINGYRYIDLLLHAIHKDCMEAQAVSFVDKIDGYCEALHEVLAGNLVFLEPVINYCNRTFGFLEENYHLISNLIRNLSSTSHHFSPTITVNLCEYFGYGTRSSRPHTQESVALNSGISVYEAWKDVTIKHIGIEYLVEQKEFPGLRILPPEASEIPTPAVLPKTYTLS